MGLFSSVLKIGGSIIGGIYGGPAGAAAGGAIGGAVGGAVDGGGSSGDSGQSATSDNWTSALTSAAGSVPGLIGGINQQNQIRTAENNSAAAIKAQIEGQRETNALNMQLAQENRAWQTNEAGMNRDWQQAMSRNAHQREILDLRDAGLNPILSVTGGNGAPMGSGGMGSGSLARTSNPYEGYAGNVAEARKIKEIGQRQLDQELQRINNENKLAESNIRLNEETANRQNAEKYKAIADTQLSNNNNNLTHERINTERFLQQNYVSQMAERESQINLNSAARGKYIVDTAIQNQHRSANEKLGGIKLWTGNVRDIVESVGEGVNSYKRPTMRNTRP